MVRLKGGVEMKRKVIFLCMISVFFVLGGLIILLFSIKKQPTVGEFSLVKYQWEIENFSYNENVGEVNNSNIAIEKAKKLWFEKFSALDEKTYNSINTGKIEISYDSEEECWHINSKKSSPNTLGGILHALIRKNGDVIAVWSDD